MAADLLSKNVELMTKEDVNRITSQLFTMVSEKRISRQDGSLLAYIASVLLQTIAPVKRKAIAQERAEFVESGAAPVADRTEEFRRRFGSPAVPEPTQMPGRTHDPYRYTGKLR